MDGAGVDRRATGAGDGPRPDRWPLIGRAGEVAAVMAAVEHASGVLLVGDAGVGKTRLAATVAAAQEEAGRRVVRVRASASTTATPLGALATVFRPSTRTESRVDLLAMAHDGLAHAAGPCGLVWCDDAHHLDDGSATVLAEAVHRDDVVLLVTARADRRLPDALAQLWQGGGLARIDVAPLDPGRSATLLRALLGGEPDPATEQRLVRTAAGNPLSLRELVLGGLDTGDLALRDGRWVLGPQLRPARRLVDIVESRLAGLQPKERLAVDLLAVAGSLGLVTLEGLTSPSVVESIDGLGFLRVDADGRRTEVRLHHPLHGEVLRAALPATRRRRLHEGLAADLQASGARRAGDHLRLAQWSLEGGRPIDPAVLVNGAELAHFAHDHALAGELALAAERAGAGTSARLVRAEAAYLDGRAADADALLTDADPTSAADRTLVALQHATVRFWGLDDAAGADAVLLAAAATVGPPHDAELLALAAQLRQLGGHPAAAMDRAAPYLDSDDRRAFIHAANAAIPALALVGRGEEALRLLDETQAAWADLGDQIAMFDPGILFASAALALMELGRLEEARGVAELGHQGALDQHTTIGRAWMALCWARAAALLGDLTSADVRYAEAGAAASGFPGLVRWAIGGQLIVAAQEGDAARCAVLEPTLLAAPPTALLLLEPEVGAALGWSAATRGHAALARERFTMAYDRATHEGATSIAIGVAHDAFRATGRPEACGAAATVTAQADATDSPLAVARARHLVAAADRDGPALEAVATAFGHLGARLLEAEAWSTAADAWARAGHQRAANRCTEQGRRSEARAQGAATPLLAVDRLVAPLTAREQEAIDLARRGLATKEIATRMGVRPRTADNHLHRAYEKLGVTGKADLHRPVGPA